MLLYEAKLLKHLEGGLGIANVYYAGSEGSRHVGKSVHPFHSLNDINTCTPTHIYKSRMYTILYNSVMVYCDKL